jgi:hypothetical protein
MARRMPLAEAVVVAGVLVMVVLLIFAPSRISPTLTLFVLVGVGLAANVASRLASRRKRQKQFLSRESLTSEELYERFYAQSGLDKDVVVRLWRDCASVLKLPAEKLRPTDRFEHEFAATDVFAALDDRREDLARYAMRRAKMFRTDLDLKHTKTLDELIRQLAAVETSGAVRGRAESLTLLADTLERLRITPESDAEALVRSLPNDLHPDAVDVVSNVWHYVADYDIRRRDEAYRQMQERELEQLIAALRRGDSREALLNYSLLG